MTTLWKLTDKNYYTRNETKWGEGIEHTASGTGLLCSAGYLHAYLSPELAVLLNPIHANIYEPVLWEAEGHVVKNDEQLKVGCSRLRTLRIVPLPSCSTEQRVRFGILCARAVCNDPAWMAWAKRWLDGTDRSEGAAEAAEAASAGVSRAAEAAAEAAEWAASTGASAAEAAKVARTAWAAWVAPAAKEAAAKEAASSAATSAAWAARVWASAPWAAQGTSAAWAAKMAATKSVVLVAQGTSHQTPLDFITIAREALSTADNYQPKRD